MITSEQIRNDLREIRYYYSRKASLDDASHSIGDSAVRQIAGTVQPRQMAGGSTADLVRLAGDIHQIGGVLGHLCDFGWGKVVHPFLRRFPCRALGTLGALRALRALGLLVWITIPSSTSWLQEVTSWSMPSTPTAQTRQAPISLISFR